MPTGGFKRASDGTVRSKPAADAPTGRFHSLFEHFRDELDEHYDRRERITKASRDVTALSKKIIFALQRVKTVNQELPPSTQKDVATRMAEITALLQSITPDLQTVNRHRYAWQLRCLEELVEALSLAHYLRHQRLLSSGDAQAALPAGLVLTPHDYMFGLFDLFGELMRFATVQRAAVLLAADGSDDVAQRPLLRDIQELACAFEMLPRPPDKDFVCKMDVMRQSVRKVENLGYGLVVRSSERPSGWLPDMKDEAPEPASPA